MRVFVTGAAGFIGSRLAKALLERGDDVIGFDNLNDYYPLEHKQRHLADLTPHIRFAFHKGDLANAPELRELVLTTKPDAVAHLAAMAAVRYSVQHPLMYGQVNVQGTMNLLDAARHLGNPRCIFASTGSTYGQDTPVPFKETAPADRPLAPYPASKRAMEILAHSYHHLWSLPTTILRFFNVYGPHGRPDMMPWIWSKLINSGQSITLYGTGKLKRDWTYIDDIVAGFLAALDKGLQYEIINLGCSQPVENLEFVQIIEELVGRRATIVDTPTPASEPLISFADISKARQMLGYDPKTNVREGLTQFVHWMRQQGLL
jgi:UDP-glucuronate 4-epimerase